MNKKIKPIPETPLEISQKLTGFPYTEGEKSTTIDPNKVRGLQTSFDLTNIKDIKIGINDIDESIKYYFEQIIKPSVIQNNQRIAIPIVYGSPERWKSAQSDGYYKDNNGKIMAPLIMFKRDNIEKNRNLGNKLDGNMVHLYQVFETKYNQKNSYDAFSVLTDRKISKQLYISVIPDYVIITYNCVIYTEYVEHMNSIIESINFASDSYWGDPTKFQFRASIDGFQPLTELNIGEQRTVKTNFTITMNGYIITNSINQKLASQQIIYTPAKIIINDEILIESLPINRLKPIRDYSIEDYYNIDYDAS